MGLFSKKRDKKAAATASLPPLPPTAPQPQKGVTFAPRTTLDADVSQLTHDTDFDSDMSGVGVRYDEETSYASLANDRTYQDDLARAGLGGSHAPAAPPPQPGGYPGLDALQRPFPDTADPPPPQLDVAADLEGLPTHWAEVDGLSLQSTAVKLAAIYQDDDDVAGAKLRSQVQDDQAADLTDPLGRGSLDPRTLRLMRTARAADADATPQTGQLAVGARRAGVLGNLRSASMLDAMSVSIKKSHPSARPMLAPRLPSDVSEAGTETSGSPRRRLNLAELTQKCSSTSETFDPVVFLSHVHAASSARDLEAGQESLRTELNKNTTDLKVLVKENFERFISCKDTIDDIHIRLRKTESDAASGSTVLLAKSIENVQHEAKAAFQPLLSRQAEADRIKNVTNVLSRFESLFNMPAQIREHFAQRDFDAVISSYAKARTLIRPGEHTIWDNLLREVEKVLLDGYEGLLQALRLPSTPPNEALEGLAYTLQLKGAGLAAASDQDPISLYLRTQQEHLHDFIQTTMHEHDQALSALHDKQHERRVADSKRRQMHMRMPSAAQDLGTERSPRPSNLRHAPTRSLLGGRGDHGRSLSGFSGTRHQHAASSIPGQVLPGGGGQLSFRAAGAPSLTPAASFLKSRSRTTANTLTSQSRADMESLWLVVIDKLTRLLFEGIPGFWMVVSHPQVHKGAQQRAVSHMEEAEAIVTEAVTSCQGHVLLAAKEVLSLQATPDIIPRVVAKLACACRELQEAPRVPVSCIAAARSMLLSVADTCVGHLGEQLITDHSPSDWEEWQLHHISDTEIVSRVPTMLQHSVVAVMETYRSLAEDVDQVFDAAGRPGAVEVQGVRPYAAVQGEHQKLLLTALFEGIRHFARGVEELASSLQGPTLRVGAAPSPAGLRSSQNASPGGPVEPPPATPELGTSDKLLVLLSNCSHVHSKMLPHLVMQYRALLSKSSLTKQEVREQQDKVQLDLEAASQGMLTQYLLCLNNDLSQAVEDYLFKDGTDWAALPVGMRVRDASLLLLHHLVACHGQVTQFAPSFRQLILDTLLEHVLAALLDQMSTHPAMSDVSVGGLVQLYSEVNFFESILRHYRTPQTDVILDSMYETILSTLLVKLGDPAAQASIPALLRADLAAVRDEMELDQALQAVVHRMVQLDMDRAAVSLKCFLQADDDGDSVATSPAVLGNYQSPSALLTARARANGSANGTPKHYAPALPIEGEGISSSSYDGSP